MRIAALYDIHGNLPALEAVLDEVAGADVDQVVIGGDVVPGPMPRETLARLLAFEIPVRFIQGNGDRVVLAHLSGRSTPEVPERFREGIRWSAAQLGRDEARVMASWPETLRMEIPPLGDVLFCHATPRNDIEIFTRLTDDAHLRPIFDGLRAALVVCGHTHMQFDRMVGATRVVNAGSVGMPFGLPGADWLLLGPNVKLRHTSYDLAAAAERIRATSYPGAADFAAQNILRAPTEAAMLEAFNRAELR